MTIFTGTWLPQYQSLRPAWQCSRLRLRCLVFISPYQSLWLLLYIDFFALIAHTILIVKRQLSACFLGDRKTFQSQARSFKPVWKGNIVNCTFNFNNFSYLLDEIISRFTGDLFIVFGSIWNDNSKKWMRKVHLFWLPCKLCE